MTHEVTMVRIYCTEGEHKMKKIFEILHDQEKVAGVTAFRGIAGFGRSGKMHTASLLDLSLDMPIIIEFFDSPDKVAAVMQRLDELIDPRHMVYWPARTNLSE